MTQKNHRHSVVNFLIATLVVAIISGACSLSIMAVAENLRFIRTADQIVQLVSLVRATATAQKDFATAPNTDILAALQHLGQILPPSANAWGGTIRALSVAGNALRIETELPAHECRRLGGYFTDYPAPRLGLITIQAQASGTTAWTQTYPAAAPRIAESQQADVACGNVDPAHLALIFRLR